MFETLTGFPDFDRDVPRNGYAWWYADAISDDGRHALALIAFVGSVFSPYYARARAHGAGDPAEHCALNVALYGEGGKRWALTERRSASLVRGRSSLAIGPSTLEWSGDALRVRIDEVAAPLPARVRGDVRIVPEALASGGFDLDASGRHRWRPIAPCARVEVRLDHPSLQWTGEGYLDSNFGGEPIEDAFAHWDWSRARVDGEAAVLYDVTRREAGNLSLALRFGRDGGTRAFEPPPRARLAPTLWRVERTTRADRDSTVRVRETLEDAPFYARSILDTRLLGRTVRAIHESLSLDRFSAGWVRCMLPFRMPRARR